MEQMKPIMDPVMVEEGMREGERTLCVIEGVVVVPLLLLVLLLLLLLLLSSMRKAHRK